MGASQQLSLVLLFMSLYPIKKQGWSRCIGGMARQFSTSIAYLFCAVVESDSEELLIIKTRESLLPALTEHVKANHEYDVPEVISLPITGGNDKYLQWLKNSTADK